MRRLLVLLLLSTPVQAAPIGPAREASLRFDLAVIANDGFSQGLDSIVEGLVRMPAEGLVSHTVQSGAAQGVLNPTIPLSGTVNVSLPEATYTSAIPGIYSGRTLGVTFTVLEVFLFGDPLSIVPATPEVLGPGRAPTLFSMWTTGTLHVAGVWSFGADTIPFDSTVDQFALTSGDNVDGPSFGFLVGSQQYQALIPLLHFQDGGVDYQGRLSAQVGAFVPEPSPAAMFLLGLVLLKRFAS